MPIHDLQFRLPVWVLGREGKAKQQEEAMRRMVGLTRAVRGASAYLFKVDDTLVKLDQVPWGGRHGAVHPVCQVPALLPHQVLFQSFWLFVGEFGAFFNAMMLAACWETISSPLDVNREVNSTQLTPAYQSP